MIVLIDLCLSSWSSGTVFSVVCSGWVTIECRSELFSSGLLTCGCCREATSKSHMKLGAHVCCGSMLVLSVGHLSGRTLRAGPCSGNMLKV